MWRDILIIAAFVLAGLTYFRLTPRRLSTYAKTAKAGIVKRNRFQKANLFLMIALTLMYISLAIWRHGTIELANFLLSAVIFFIAWHTILSVAWGLSERGEKILDIVKYSIFFPLFVATLILIDMHLWQKIVYPLAGFGVGFGVRRLVNYVGAKLKRRRSSKETNNSSTTTK